MLTHAPARDVTDDQHCAWHGELTWRRTAELREMLFDLLEAELGRLVLDVSAVHAVDRTGVALLVGCRRRAAIIGRSLVLVDRHGVVTDALSAAGLLSAFEFDDPTELTG